MTAQDSNVSFSVAFADFAEDGTQLLNLLTTVFTVDNAQPFTTTSFRSEASGAQTAINFANMIMSNPDFINYVVDIDGDTATVTAVKPGAIEIGDFVFTPVGFVSSPVITSTNGSKAVRTGRFLVYDIYQGAKKIAGRNSVNFLPDGLNGKATIFFEQGFLFPGYEPRLSLLPWAEKNFYLEVLWKAALVTQNSICQQEPIESTWSNYTLVSSIFQAKDSNLFLNYSTYPVKWITGNPLERTLCKDVFEVAGIWLENDGTFRDVNPFRVEFKVVLIDGSIEMLATFLNPNTSKFWFVPTGTLNGVYSGLVDAGINYVEIKIIGYLPDNSPTNYSEVLKRYVSDKFCDCKLNLIYLGDLGSFDTLGFGEHQRARQSVGVANRIFGQDIYLTDQVPGQRQIDIVNSADLSDIYKSRVIGEAEQRRFEELQRSTQIYRVVEIEGEFLLEKLGVKRGDFTNADQSGGASFELEVSPTALVKFHQV